MFASMRRLFGIGPRPGHAAGDRPHQAAELNDALAHRSLVALGHAVEDGFGHCSHLGWAGRADLTKRVTRGRRGV
jgi:hypothetical protein